MKIQWGLVSPFLTQRDARVLETVSPSVAVEAAERPCDAHTCATCRTMQNAGWFGRRLEAQSKRRKVWSNRCKMCTEKCDVMERDYMSIISAAINTGEVFLQEDLPPVGTEWHGMGNWNLCINNQKFETPQYVTNLTYAGIRPKKKEELGWHGNDGWENAILKSIWRRVNGEEACEPEVSMCWSVSMRFNVREDDDGELTITKEEWEPALVWLKAIRAKFAQAHTSPRCQEKLWFYAVYKGNSGWNNDVIKMCMHITQSAHVDKLNKHRQRWFQHNKAQHGIPSVWTIHDSWVAAISGAEEELN